MAEVTFDYRNLVEVEGGLRSDELDEVRSRLYAPEPNLPTEDER